MLYYYGLRDNTTSAIEREKIFLEIRNSISSLDRLPYGLASEISRKLSIPLYRVESYRRRIKKDPNYYPKFPLNLEGESFSRLKVISYSGRGKWGAINWSCLCECGEKREASTKDLRNGAVKSCKTCSSKKPKGSNNHGWTGYRDITGSYWSSIRCGAGYRGIEFNISKEEAWDLYEDQGRKCKLSGLDIVVGFGGTQTASLDRIDSGLGYCIENVQWVHKIINLMKADLKQEEFLFFVSEISKHNEHTGSKSSET